MRLTNLSFNSIFLFLCLIAYPALAETASKQAESATPALTLTLEVSGLKSDDGAVRVGIYDSEATYNAGQVLQGAELKIVNGQSQWIIGNLAPGDYAIKSFHDKNSNGEMDKNMVGIPTEAYAFSNGAIGRFGAPKFSEAKFSVTQEQTTQSLIFE